MTQFAIYNAASKANNRKQKTVSPMPVDIKASLLLIKKHIKPDEFKAVIDRQYPLEKIVDAYKYVEKGQKKET